MNQAHSPASRLGPLRTAGLIGAGSALLISALVALQVETDKQAPAPLPAAASAPPPAGPAAPGPAYEQGPGAPKPSRHALELVVKMKDDAKIRHIIDAFWRDPDAARTHFAKWTAGREEFAGLRLERVTYSNELVLVLIEDGGPALRAAALREAARKLAAAPDISYAEQQAALAYPGGQ